MECFFSRSAGDRLSGSCGSWFRLGGNATMAANGVPDAQMRKRTRGDSPDQVTMLWGGEGGGG